MGFGTLGEGKASSKRAPFVPIDTGCALALQTEMAILDTRLSKELLLIPDLLVPYGWTTSVSQLPQILYKARAGRQNVGHKGTAVLC